MVASNLPPFAALRAFDLIGRSGGIRKAAMQLGISHAIVSRHLATLEQHLGVTLFNRRTGELTGAGRQYHARISAAIGELEAATTSMRGERRNSLRIWCSAGLSLHWLGPRLPEFQRLVGAKTAALVDLCSTDAEPAFDQGEADGDIRYLADNAAPVHPTAVRTEVLARPDVFPVVSRDFLGNLRAPFLRRQDILSLPLVHEGAGEEWKSWMAAQGISPALQPQPAARFGQAHLALMAARAGQGVALANAFLVAEDLAHGTLVPLEPAEEGWQAVQLGAYCFRASRARWSDPLVMRFRRWLRQSMSSD